MLETDAARGIIQTAWNGLPIRFPSVELDQFIIMPNHVHGIIVITDTQATGPVGATYELPLQNKRKQR